MSENRKIEFGTAVRAHLKALKIEHRELAEALRVKPSQVSAWLADEENEGYRAVSVDTVGRIADFLKDRYDSSELGGSDEFGKQRPFELANRLLKAARLKLPFETSEDSVWWRIRSARAEQVKSPVLRVGWFPWGNFANGEFTGLSRIITDELLRLMDLTMQPVELRSYADMVGFLENQKIDMIAPLMMAPFRMFQFWCSSSIGTKCGLNLLGVRKYVEPLLPQGKGSITDVRELDGSKFRICYVTGGVAQFLRPRLRDERRAEPHDNAEDAIESVLDTPVDTTGTVRLFCGDQFTCRAKELEKKDKDPMLLLRKPYNKVPIVFGVAPREKGLLWVIDQTIKLMLPETRKLFRSEKFSSDLFG